jgi:hypothetical protein
MVRSLRQVTGQILKRNPNLSRNLVNGDFNLSAWLFRRAMSGLSWSNAIYLAATVFMRHPGRFVSNFIPEMVELSVGAIYRWVRHAPKTRFVIGSVGTEVQTSSRRSSSCT